MLHDFGRPIFQRLAEYRQRTFSITTDTMIGAIDEARVEAFTGLALREDGAATNVALVTLGDRGRYRA